jgi:hypothetical protein
MHSDEQYAMSSHKLRDALMLMEFLKMYYTRPKKKNGFSPQVNYTDLVTALVGEVSANFCGYIHIHFFHLFYIYFHLKCNLLYSHPSSTLHVLDVYSHHQVSSLLLKLLQCMSKFCITCEHDIS